MAFDQLLPSPHLPIPVRSPLATPAGVDRAGVEAFVREIGSTVRWQVLPGASRDIKRLTCYMRALGRELEIDEIRRGVHNPPPIVVLDLFDEPAALN